jgi:hypothetical protein
MSPLIKKEIRLVLPAWALAMALAIIPAWIVGTAWNLINDSGFNYSVQAQSGLWLEGLVPIIFALGLLLLGLTPFGQEFSQGTFTVLLSQPVERSRVWRTKIFLVATAFLVVWLAAVISVWCQYYLYDHFHPVDSMHRLHYLYFNKNYEYFSAAFDHTAVVLALSVLVVFSGGLWTTLLLRQVTNAFWCTLLTPIAIILGIMSLLSNRIASDQDVGRIIAVALAIYSVAGFCIAALLFRRCQDLQSSGGEVSFPSFKKLAGLGTPSRARAISFHPRHRFIALAWKEIQLHQVNVLIAALILLLHLSSLIIRHFHPHFIDPDLQFVFGTIWLLWLLMPVLVGCSAIAEERRLGIMESQLSLPVSRRMQLFIKFSIGLIISLFLGAALPLLVEGTKDVNGWLFVVAGGLFFVSFYASSMSRTVLQAIGLAIVIGTALFFGDINTAINVFQYFSSHFSFYGAPWDNFGLIFLKACLSLTLLLLVLVGLTFWNYQQLRQNTILVLVNLLAILVVFVAIYPLTWAIYYRAWEYVTPTLPFRGPARLTSSSDIKLAGSFDAIYAVLPDGRLSAQTHIYRPWLNGFMVSTRENSSFVPGTNWTEATADNFQAVGIRSDGSLWSIRRPWDTSHRWFEPKGTVMLAQIGSDTNWSQVADSHIGFLLLKKDGSLWVWGTNGLDWTRDLDRFQKSLAIKLHSDLAMPPTRLDNGTNWNRLYSSVESAYAMNDNSDVWSWLSWAGTNNVSQFTRDYSANGPWSSFTPGWNDGMYVGVKADGTLWFRNHINITGKEGTSYNQLGRGGKKWKAATFGIWNGWNAIIAIRSDGTLWNCTDFNPVQLGTHSDWIALSPGGLALASDGSLWAWNQLSWHIWLGPSRKPKYMGNIFEGATAAAAANP